VCAFLPRVCKALVICLAVNPISRRGAKIGWEVGLSGRGSVSVCGGGDRGVRSAEEIKGLLPMSRLLQSLVLKIIPRYGAQSSGSSAQETEDFPARL